MSAHKPIKSVTTALGATVAAAAALFLSAGTAQANPAENNELRVQWSVVPEGLRTFVQIKTGQAANCFYRSYHENLPSGIPTVPLPIPVYYHDFHLPPNGSYDWPIGGVPLNQPWRTTIDCPGVGFLEYRGRY